MRVNLYTTSRKEVRPPLPYLKTSDWHRCGNICRCVNTLATLMRTLCATMCLHLATQYPPVQQMHNNMQHYATQWWQGLQICIMLNYLSNKIRILFMLLIRLIAYDLQHCADADCVCLINCY